MRKQPGVRSALAAACIAAALFVVLACMAAHAASGSADELTTLRPGRATAGRETGKPAPKAHDPYAKDVTKRGNTVVVSRKFAAAARKDNSVLLSTVAVRARTDKAGRLAGYQLVTIDQGSSVSKMGFKPGDVVTAINGIPAREFEANRPSLESATRFDVDFTRKGTARKLSVEIR
jgi:type II secretory pathway component PulC